MKSNFICWIDDSPKLMHNIAISKFKRLWEHNIDSTIVFFGDNYKENKKEPNLDIEYFEDFKDSLFDISSEFQNMQKPELKNNLDGIFIPNINNVNSIQPLEFDDLINAWKEITSNSDISLPMYNVDNLANKIIKSFPDVSCYGLDLTLLYNDFSRAKMKLPILSMALYNFFRCHKITCFLYSLYTHHSEYFISWKETYKIKYPKDDLRNFTFFSRMQMLEDGDDVIEKILSFMHS